MRWLILSSAIIATLAVASVGSATTIHVPEDQPTIQAGIDAAVNGDTVLVSDGIYTGTGNRDIDFLGKAIVLMSENGPENCMIDCQGSEEDPHCGFYFQNEEDRNSVLKGFTITNGYQLSYGGAGGIWIDYECSPSIHQNIFTNHYYDAIHLESAWSAIVANCTFALNQRAIYSYGSNYPIVTNCIFWDNEFQIYENKNPSSVVVTYCDIEGGYPGEGNINSDPLFVYSEGNDFHLLPDSPCIDSGDPESALDPDSTRADMGSLYYDQSSEVTLYALPETKTYYPRLDSLRFSVFVANNADTSISFQGWTEAETPWGMVISPVLGPVSALLGANRYLYSQYYQQIPEYAPYGSPYKYSVIVGEHPNVRIPADIDHPFRSTLTIHFG